jgi:hypothetical protein
MPDEEEHQPGDRAPATAHYEELNVFGPHGPLSMFVKAIGFHLRHAALRGGGYVRRAASLTGPACRPVAGKPDTGVCRATVASPY